MFSILSKCLCPCVWPPWQEISYNVLMISDGTKRSSTCFLKYRSPITWYRQVQRQIAWFQGWKRFLFHDYRNKTFDILKNMLFISKKTEIWYLRLPRRGQDFWNLARFAWSPIVAPWSAHDRPVIIWEKWKKVNV